MKKLLTICLSVLCCAVFLLSCEKEPAPVAPPTDPVVDTIPAADTLPPVDTVPQPTACFRYDLGTSLAVSFTNTSLNATSYLWDFGDGSTSTAISPIHAFASVGSKTVTLTAFNGDKSANYSATFDMTSHIRLMSTSENPYTIYIDGAEVGSIGGGGVRTFPVTPGNHSVRVLQESGYVFYATDETYNVTCTAGGTISQEFPEDSWGK